MINLKKKLYQRWKSNKGTVVRLHSPLTMETLERENRLGCCHVWLAVSRGGFTEQCGTCQVEWMWYYTRTFNEIWEGEEERLYNPVSMQQQNVHRERDIPGEERREDRRPQLQSLRVLWQNHSVSHSQFDLISNLTT